MPAFRGPGNSMLTIRIRASEIPTFVPPLGLHGRILKASYLRRSLEIPLVTVWIRVHPATAASIPS